MFILELYWNIAIEKVDNLIKINKNTSGVIIKYRFIVIYNLVIINIIASLFICSI